MKRIIHSALIFALLVSFSSTALPAPAIASTGPLGSADNPFLIRSAADLSRMENGNANTHYRLEEDFTVTSPVGRNIRGILDGNHRTITLNITSSGTGVGLFGTTKGVEVRNLRLAGSVRSTSGENTGALIGVSYDANVRLENIHSSVTVSGNRDTGGLIGHTVRCHASITNVTVSGNVTGSSGVGGIVGGSQQHSIFRSVVTGNVTGTAATGNVGGIVGIVSTTTASSRSIRQSAMLGNVSGQNDTGGIVGNATGNTMIIEDCYVWGNVHGTTYTGGIAGSAGSSAASSQVTIRRTYSSGTVSGANRIGGIAGTRGSISSSFALNPELRASRPTAVTLHLGRVGGNPTSMSNNRALNTMRLFDRGNAHTPTGTTLNGIGGLSITDADVRGRSDMFAAQGWDFNNVWMVQSGGYPILRNAGYQEPEPPPPPNPIAIFVGASDFRTFDLPPSHTITSVTAAPTNIASWVVSGNRITVTGLRAGETTLTIRTSLGHSILLSVTVANPPPPLDLFVGETVTREIVLPSGHSITTVTASPTGIVSWTISGNRITVIGQRAGVTTLTVRTNMGNTTLRVTVAELPLPLELYVGETETVTVGTSNHTITSVTAAPTGIASWIISGNQVTVTGLAAGETTLTIRTNLGNTSLVVTVNPIPSAYICEMPWLDAICGWPDLDVERKTNVGENPISIGGEAFPDFGFGTHTFAEPYKNADVVVDISKAPYTVFEAWVGMDDEVRAMASAGNAGSFVFEVWVDGNLAARSPILTYNAPAYYIAAHITGGSTLTLRVRSVNGHYFGWASWGNARVFIGDETDTPSFAPPQFASDFVPVNATSGWNTPQINANITGGRLSIGGREFDRGIGTHVIADPTAGADFTIDISGLGYTIFEAVVGIDDAMLADIFMYNPSTAGRFVFEILVNGNPVPVRQVSVSAFNPAATITAGIAGADTLTLRVRSETGDAFFGWANWGDPLLYATTN
jgi:hypothetical protein